MFFCLFVSFAAKAQAGGATACSPLSRVRVLLWLPGQGTQASFTLENTGT